MNPTVDYYDYYYDYNTQHYNYPMYQQPMPGQMQLTPPGQLQQPLPGYVPVGDGQNNNETHTQQAPMTQFQTPCTAGPSSSSVFYSPESPENSTTQPLPQQQQQLPSQTEQQQTSKKPAQASKQAETEDCGKVEDEEKAFVQVEGRIPMVNQNTSYGVSMSEVRRRVGAPEYISATTLGSLFKTSKTASHVKWMKNLIRNNNIEFASHRRLRRSNVLTGLSEAEGQEVMRDIDYLNTKHYPVDETARKLIEKLLTTGYQLPQVHSHLTSALKFMNTLVASMTNVQPVMTGFEERMKGTSFDEPYRLYSTVTHGTGHMYALTHYKIHLRIYKAAVEKCVKVLKGEETFTPVTYLAPGQKPFATITDKYFMEQYQQPIPQPQMGNQEVFQQPI